MFLDEIGEISLTMQVKILRVLQEKKFERVGGEKTITVDVRIIAATNRNLEAEIAKGHFREDLYYRLNVVHVEMPPLRERREDIPALITRFLREASALHGIEAKSLSQRAYDLLLQYSWPGNIRELKNCIESALIISEKNTIDIADLPRAVAGSHAVNRSDGAPPSESSLEEIERAAVEEALRVTHGNKTKSAALLGIQRSTLYYKMKKYNLH